MISDNTLQRVVRAIYDLPELNGCLIAFYGNGQSSIIGYPSCVTPNSENIAVIIEEVGGDQVLSGTLQKMVDSGQRVDHSVHGIPKVTNRSRLGPELVGAGVSCGLTVVSAIGVVGGAAAEVPTGGASTFLVVASWSGLATGGIQCLNGMVRVGAIFFNPDDDSLTQWDKNQVYSYGILLVDAIGVLGAAASLPYAFRNLWAIISRQRTFVALNLTFQTLRGMNRAQRLKVIAQCFFDAAKTPEGRKALVVAAREAEVGAKAFQRVSGLSVRHASTLVRIITEETARRLSSSLRDILSGIIGIGASATPASSTGSASGSVNYVINLLDAGAPKL